MAAADPGKRSDAGTRVKPTTEPAEPTEKDPQWVAMQRARWELRRAPLYLDTETTGLGEDAQVVEICVLDARGATVVDTLVKPEGRIPPDATDIHGIDDAMVKDAPTWPEVWSVLEPRLSGRRVGIYNARFDVRIIQRVNRRHGLARTRADARAFCIMDIYSRYRAEPTARGAAFRRHKLEEAGKHCSIRIATAHRAHADTQLARALLQHIAWHKPAK